MNFLFVEAGQIHTVAITLLRIEFANKKKQNNYGMKFSQKNITRFDPINCAKLS